MISQMWIWGLTILSVAATYIVLALFIHCFIVLPERKGKKMLRKVVFKDGTSIIGRRNFICWWHDTWNARHIISAQDPHKGSEIRYYTNAVKYVVYIKE
jgi:hypothetical protein